MASFLDPFAIRDLGRPMNDHELCRAIRQSIAAEEEATHLYEAYADACESEKAREVFQDIANEEKVHIGEFQELLKHFTPDEEKFLEDGKGEVKKMFEGKAAAKKVARITERLLVAVNVPYKSYTYFSTSGDFQLSWFFYMEEGESLMEITKKLNDWKKEILLDIREVKTKLEGFKISGKLAITYGGRDTFYAAMSFRSLESASNVAIKLSGMDFKR